MSGGELDKVICPACCTPCKVTVHTEDGETWTSAVCPNCAYELDSEGVITVRQMLEGAETGPTWNDVDLPTWTRLVAEALGRQPCGTPDRSGQ